jgi:hypothetical protein
MSNFTVVSKSDLELILLPENFTVLWSDDQAYGVISGVGYGVGSEFKTVELLENYIYSNGWSRPTDN